jgi:methylmalonyl-CoA mutase N-terminal domain/subunit
MNNISRVTIQTLAAVMGGTQSLHTNGYDEALSLPTEQAAATALRTQQIVGFESGVADAADPLAGSYLVESLTDEIAQKAAELISAIDAMGGSIPAIEEGFMQNEISRSAYEYQRAIETGEKTIVGVNKFTVEKELPVPSFKINDSIRVLQSQRLTELRVRRDNELAIAKLNSIKQAAIDGNNIMPPVIEAVEAYCTLGEIADVLRQEFGEYNG